MFGSWGFSLPVPPPPPPPPLRIEKIFRNRLKITRDNKHPFQWHTWSNKYPDSRTAMFSLYPVHIVWAVFFHSIWKRNVAYSSRVPASCLWASCQISKIAGCACDGTLHSPQRISDLDMRTLFAMWGTWKNTRYYHEFVTIWSHKIPDNNVFNTLSYISYCIYNIYVGWICDTKCQDYVYIKWEYWCTM